jgi:Ulp1 family protease
MTDDEANLRNPFLCNTDRCRSASYSARDPSHTQTLPKSTADEAIEKVTYSEGGPDAITIMKKYVELLDPGKFVNDNIIDFYIK